MKTASVLFGLITAACAANPPQPSHPLCDREGAPACGNIGQVGRSEAPQPAPTTNVVRTIAKAASTIPSAIVNTTDLAAGHGRAVPVVKVLLGHSAQQGNVSGVLRRPLIDNREEIACGNVMYGKGGHKRVCRDAQGNTVSSTDSDDYYDSDGDTDF